MPKAAPSINRRDFLGHVAGAYTAATLVAGTAVPVTLALLIQHHRATYTAWGDACALLDTDEPCEDDVQRAAQLEYLDELAIDALATYRPVTIEEARERFAYLYGHMGPWDLFQPRHEQFKTLIASMMPENA
ncbi:twin-arginine translocation signal domain-containing protein [Aureimonas sp. AU12]|uniref:twin-arginine translocation signal domain-containing protein n=1 Tax=Aureimonas sp. AU12 TaxID=1638161 RepID=UPI000781C751|nr:twin-arginine translocation signal domain-containing protein [Aureimonas sp. AU12]